MESQNLATGTEKTDGCAPGCCVAIIVLGGLFALFAGFFAASEPCVKNEVRSNPARYAEAPPTFSRALEEARAQDQGALLVLVSLAYLFLVGGALELWHARKPEPFAFGKPLSQLGAGIPVDAEGHSHYMHPLRYARYALPVLAGVLVYDAAFAGLLLAWTIPIYCSLPCGLVAALFNINALVMLHRFLAARVVSASVRPTSTILTPGAEIEVAYEVVARKQAPILKLKLILLGVETYFPKARWWQESTTQRLACVYRVEKWIWSDGQLEPGESRRGSATLHAPNPLPMPARHQGKLLWFVALAVEIPAWPDFEVVEKLELEPLCFQPRRESGKMHP